MPEGFTDSLPLSRSTLDRDAAARDRPGVLEETWSDPATRVAVLQRGLALLAADGDGLALVPPSTLPEPALLLYLGRTTEDGDPPAGTVVLGAVYEDEAVQGEWADLRLDGARLGARDAGLFAELLGAVYEDEVVEGEWADLRLDGARLGARDAGLFAELLGLANWHRVSAFSPRTGAPTVPGRGGWVRHPDGQTAESSGQHVFPRTDPAVIMGVVDGLDRLLLARNGAWPEGRVSVLAGFVEPGESFETAVRREVFEEVGVHVGTCEYLGSQPWPFPASVMIGFLARVDGDGAVELHPDGEEIREARWWSREDLAAASGDTIRLPGRTSIARAIIEHWYGGRLEGDW